MAIYSRQDLIDFVPHHATFAGIDSDGCIFDTMEIKQKQCFHPQIIAHWGLQTIAPYVREVAEFVNLYSAWRGQNRFTAIVQTFELLSERPEVRASGVRMPALRDLKKLIKAGGALGNPTLEAEAKRTGSRELASVLEWSLAVNAVVAERASHSPPFDGARKCLEKLQGRSDVVCVSQTPAEALEREWQRNDLCRYARVIAGQEMGTKTEHIRLATRGRYAPHRVLVIGDARGDLRAAKANGALFYPVNPGREVESWARLLEEAYDRFLDGNYAGEYEAARIREFRAILPETPPWIEQTPETGPSHT